MNALKERLKEWTDFDVALYGLGVVIGIFEKDTWFDNNQKWIFWSNNPLGNTLHEILGKLVSTGILEENDYGQFRWKDQPIEDLLKIKSKQENEAIRILEHNELHPGEWEEYIKKLNE